MTGARVIGILIAHLGAVGSHELIIDSFSRMQGGAKVIVTHVYLGLRHTTSKIKDISWAFCLNSSTGYAHLAV